MARIAIIGAGMAGLSAARALHDSGHAVRVFEKSRAIGGRISTRETRSGEQFDHGAQFVRAKGDAFAAYLADAREAGHASLWQPREGDAERPFVVGTPRMRDLVQPLADGLDIRFEHTVGAVERSGDGWSVDGDGGFDALICAVPQPQTIKLLADFGVAETLAPVCIAPCWSVMLTFGQPLDVAFDTQRDAHDVLGWVARDTSKPGRGRGGDRWVLHARPGWSRQHLELDGENVLLLLLSAFAGMAGRLPEPTYAAAHRWRYAMTEVPLGQPCLVMPETRLIVAGDWCLGGRVEAAFESGRAAAKAAADLF